MSSVKCKVDAIGNVQRSMFLFVPIDRLLVSRDYPSSCIFISNFRAHAHYSISISIDFTLNTRVRQQDRNECCYQHWGDMCLRSPHSLTKFVGTPIDDEAIGEVRGEVITSA